MDKFGRLDAVCHFAAIHSTLNWEDVSNKEFNRVLEVNVVGSFNVAKAAAFATLKDPTTLTSSTLLNSLLETSSQFSVE